MVLIFVNLTWSENYFLASMDGINFDSVSTEFQSSSSDSQESKSENRVTDTAIDNALSLDSKKALKNLLEISDGDISENPRLWYEIGRLKSLQIDSSQPVHIKSEQLNPAYSFFRKAAKSKNSNNSEIQKWIDASQELTSIPDSTTWHSKQIDKALRELTLSNNQKAYEWSLVILFKYARKHNFKSARLNYEIAMQYSRMSQMKQYSLRKKEFLKEMNIFIKRAAQNRKKHLVEYPQNDYFANKALLISGVVPHRELKAASKTQETNVQTEEKPSQVLEIKNKEEKTVAKSQVENRTVAEAEYVDSTIVSALEANKENRLDWSLKTLYETKKDIGKKSSKLSYFLAKQHQLLAKASKSNKQRNQNLDSAKKLLEEAVLAGKTVSKSHPENKKWAAAAKTRLNEYFKNSSFASDPKPKKSSTGMILPTKGLVTSLYGMRLHPIYGTWKKHKGMDIAEYGNPPVRAMANGVVTRARWFSGYGNGVEIKYDNGYTSFYGHLRDMNGSAGRTRVGMRVKKGQTVGHMGHTGLGAGDHLHLEMDYKGRLIDPLPVISRIAGVAVRQGTEL